MSSFGNVQALVFDQRAEARLSEEDERAFVAACQAGDSSHLGDLVLSYAPALRQALAAFRRAVWNASPDDVEEVRSDLVLAFVEAVHALDLDRYRRLAATIGPRLQNVVSTAAKGATQFAVPERTLKRFFGILRAADGDAVKAALIAPQHEMKAETFLAILDSVRSVESFESAADGNSSGFSETTGERFVVGQERGVLGESLTVSSSNPIADVEDRVLVEAAFAAVDQAERDVVGLAYGFADFEPLVDDEIAERVGKSRATVQRTRTKALGKMRSALGVA